MTASPIDRFDLRTIDLGSMKAPAFCYKGLAAFRIDKYVRDLAGDTELWTVAVLHNNTLFPAVPVFKTIETVTGFIFDVSALTSWEKTLTSEELGRIMEPLIQMLSHYNSFPFEIILDKFIPEKDRARLTIPIPSASDT